VTPEINATSLISESTDRWLSAAAVAVAADRKDDVSQCRLRLVTRLRALHVGMLSRDLPAVPAAEAMSTRFSRRITVSSSRYRMFRQHRLATDA